MKFSLQALRSKLRFEDRTSRIVLIVVLLAVIGYAAYEIAIIYSLLGDADSAFNWLTKAEREHAVGFTFVRVDPRLEAVRSDPRFKELVRGTDKTIP